MVFLKFQVKIDSPLAVSPGHGPPYVGGTAEWRANAQHGCRFIRPYLRPPSSRDQSDLGAVRFPFFLDEAGVESNINLVDDTGQS